MIARAMLLYLLATVLAAPAFAAGTAVEPGEGTLARAIQSATPSDILVLRAGIYEGAVSIDRPLTIRSEEGAEVHGPGAGTVITVDAPDVTVYGLKVMGSGSSHETLDSGIKLTKKAAKARVEHNTLVGNLHGIDIHGARDAIAIGNSITGRTDHRMNDRGNGVYVWNAPGAVVENNTIRLGRDGIFVNTSKKNIFRGNRFEDVRFAVHYMYANDSEISGNVSIGNHLGYALMFSSRLVVRDNVSIGDREHGIMLNYANGSTIENKSRSQRRQEMPVHVQRQQEHAARQPFPRLPHRHSLHRRFRTQHHHRQRLHRQPHTGQIRRLEAP